MAATTCTLLNHKILYYYIQTLEINVKICSVFLTHNIAEVWIIYILDMSGNVAKWTNGNVYYLLCTPNDQL